MNRIKISIFLILIFCLNIYANSRLKNIHVIPYASTMRLNDCNSNMKVNGEYNVIKHLIKSGDVVFDVGASRGDWSNCVFSLHKAVLVYAFEPIPDVFTSLQETCKDKLGFAYNLALSNKKGKSEFCYYSSNYSNSRMSGFYDRKILKEKLKLAHEKIMVEVDTLDSFCSENLINHIAFLKIDTEGEELNVLKGALGLLQNKAISAIQFEYGGCYIDSESTLQEVYKLLSKHGYAIFRIFPKGLIKIEKWKDQLENYKYCNYLAVLH